MKILYFLITIILGNSLIQTASIEFNCPSLFKADRDAFITIGDEYVICLHFIPFRVKLPIVLKVNKRRIVSMPFSFQTFMTTNTDMIF